MNNEALFIFSCHNCNIRNIVVSEVAVHSDLLVPSALLTGLKVKCTHLFLRAYFLSSWKSKRIELTIWKNPLLVFCSEKVHFREISSAY